MISIWIWEMLSTKEKRQVRSKRRNSSHVSKKVVIVPGTQNTVNGIPRGLNIIIKVKVKVKVRVKITLEQTTKAQSGSRDIALLFL
jgi:hypothetical protein